MRAKSVLILLTVTVSTATAGCAAAPAPTPVSTPAPAPPPRPVPVNSVPPGRAQVIVNGDLGPTGPVVCSSDDGLITISIGDSSLGVTVVVTDDDMPAVRSVSVGDVGDVALGFAVGAAGPTPTASRNGATVVVSGSASGTDSADPARVVDSSYQIAVACP